MKNTYKNIAIAITFLLLGSTVGYTYSGKSQKQMNKNIPIEKVKNTVDYDVNTIRKISNEIIPEVEPFSSNIVIYNSHPFEAYMCGTAVTDISASISNKLKKDSVQNEFLRVAPAADYFKSYESSRNLIISKVKGYDKTILLDIHRNSSDTSQSDTKTILLVLDKGNPHYDENKKFADQLLKTIKESNKVKVDYELYEMQSGFFNQDLSSKSVMIEVGNEKSSDNEINECIDEIVSALVFIQNNSIEYKS